MNKTTFTDAAGRPWTLRFDNDAADRMEAAGFDLVGDPEGLSEQFARIGRKPRILADVLAAALQPKLREAGIEAFEFRNAIVGDAAEAAATAFLNAVGEYFPKLRPLIEEAQNRIAPALDRAVAELTQQVASGQMDGVLLGSSSGSAPASSASTPVPTAFAS